MPRFVLTFENSTAVPHTYWVEPWAHDFTMLSGELFELCISAKGEFQAHVIQGSTSSQIYLDHIETFTALQGGKEIELGHNRQHEVGTGQ